MWGGADERRRDEDLRARPEPGAGGLLPLGLEALLHAVLPSLRLTSAVGGRRRGKIRGGGVT